MTTETKDKLTKLLEDKRSFDCDITILKSMKTEYEHLENISPRLKKKLVIQMDCQLEILYFLVRDTDKKCEKISDT